jgi:HEAT repeat protein
MRKGYSAVAPEEFSTSAKSTSGSEFDLFISHASEDKNEVARPLVEALRSKELRVWFDEQTLTIGDSLRQKIDEGLAKCRYGVVIFSPSFFGKRWPNVELDGLAAREEYQKKVILPIWHKVSYKEVADASPTLAIRLAVPTNRGLDHVVEEIMRVVRPEWQPADQVKIDDLFDPDPVVGFRAADHLASEECADLQAVVNRLRGLNLVSILSAREFLGVRAEETAPLMIEKIRNAHEDWGAATYVPDCFDIAHERYCSDMLMQIATTTEHPDVSRKATEALGFVGAGNVAFGLLNLLKGRGDYWYSKLESYVVLALARILCLQVDPYSYPVWFRDELRSSLDLLEEAVRMAASHGWKGALYQNLLSIISVCPIDRADLFLSEWLNADHVDLRRLAVRALGQMRLARSTPHLKQRLQDRNENESVRREAAYALGNIGGPQTAQFLYEISAAVPNPKVASGARAGLAFCLHQVTDMSSLEGLGNALLRSDLSEKLWVYRAWGLSGDTRFAVRLQDALTDFDPTIRATAALGLSRLSGREELPLLEVAYAEAGTLMEQILVGLALLHAQGSDVNEDLLGRLRNDLKGESYSYHRLTKEDILSELRRTDYDTAKLMVSSWERVYMAMPDY